MIKVLWHSDDQVEDVECRYVMENKHNTAKALDVDKSSHARKKNLRFVMPFDLLRREIANAQCRFQCDLDALQVRLESVRLDSKIMQGQNDMRMRLFSCTTLQS